MCRTVTTYNYHSNHKDSYIPE